MPSCPVLVTPYSAAWRAFLSRLWLGRGGDEVMTEADERGLCLDGARCEQDVLAPPWVCPLGA
jgi:hypothetical protein